jgi:hypothetical protein
VTINTATGAITNVGALPNGIDALAFAPAPVVIASTPVPTLGEWTLIALALAIGAAGAIAFGRRNA